MAKNPTKTRPAQKVIAPTSTHMSISIRKIDNGYIISKAHDGPKGYTHSETFSAKKPVIEVPKTTVKSGK